MKRLSFLLIALMLSLCGCENKPKKTIPDSVVIGVTVYCSRQGHCLLNRYTEESDISLIMEQLRHLELRFPTDRPDTPVKERYSILVKCANGKSHTYEFLDNAYFRKDQGRWRRIIADDSEEYQGFLLLTSESGQ